MKNNTLIKPALSHWTKVFSVLVFEMLCITIALADTNLHFSIYTTEEGLSHNTVWSVHENNKGIIYAATSNGINYFDGVSFISLLKKDNGANTINREEYRVIQEDVNGYIWAQTGKGNFHCYDPKAEDFINVPIPDSLLISCNKIHMAPTGDVWLWGDSLGCARLISQNNTFISEIYFKGKDAITDTTVYFITSSDEGGVFISTEQGIYLLREKTECIYKPNGGLFFTRYIETPNKIFFFSPDNVILAFSKKNNNFHLPILLPENIENESIIDIEKTDDEKLLFTTSESVYSIDTETLLIRESVSLFEESSPIRNTRLFKDNRNNLWAYTPNGTLWHYSNNKVKKLTLPINTLSPETISFFEDSRGYYWILAYGYGAFMYNPTDNQIMHFEKNRNTYRTINSNEILSIMEDKSGVLWLGSEYGGITRITVPNYKINTIFPENENLIKKENSIKIIHESSNKNLWIGNSTGNLYIYNEDYIIQKEIPGNSEWTASASDKSGNIWLGTKNKGLRTFSGNSDISESFPAGINGIPQGAVNSILCDKKNRIWIGFEKNGLRAREAEKKNSAFRDFFTDTPSKRSILSMTADNDGLIWAGSEEGLYIFHPDSLFKNDKKFRYIPYSSYMGANSEKNRANVLYTDREGQLWIGTSGAGLICYIRKSGIDPVYLEIFNNTKGLPSNTIRSIAEDNSGSLWIGTDNGICRFNPQSRTFENYRFATIEPGNIYNQSAAIIKQNGDLIFGSMYGFYMFNPSHFNKNNYVPKVLITNLKINGEDFVRRENDNASHSLIYTPSIELEYSKDILTFEFLFPNYNYDNLNKYTYILEGFDKHWTDPATHNQAIYRNLPPGKYTLKVKACNSTGIWTPESSDLKIIIRPPFYFSGFAWGIYITLFFVILFLSYRIITRINRLRSKIRIEKTLSDYKMRFFTAMSNELKLPVAHIQESAILAENDPYISESVKRRLKWIRRNSKQMLQMIDMLFESNQIEEENKRLALEETDIVAFVRKTYRELKDMAIDKGIKFRFYTSDESINIPVDKIKLGKILFNLCLNLYDLMPSKGHISIHISKEGKRLCISLVHNASSLPSSIQDLLTSAPITRKLTTPIELSIRMAYELSLQHKGNFTYERPEGSYSRFIIWLPLSASVYDASSFILNSNKRSMPETTFPDFIIQNDTEPIYLLASTQLKSYQILVVDRNEEVCSFLFDELGKHFTVKTSMNSTDAFHYATQNIPSLIICDVDMPDSDGYEFTQKIKTSFDTSHIPVILLSQHMQIEYQVKGIEAGADDYITKPFSLKLLIARIIKLIEQREKLQHRFSEKPNMAIPTITSSDRERSFINKVHEVIEENIGNPDFTVDDFARAVHLGRTIFYRKLKSVVGYPPNEYIRLIRMNKAAELLRTQKYTVSEICYMVGFNDPFYFSKCFKNQFGRSPSAYQKETYV